MGRWAKKVRGRVVYFTNWRDDPKGVAALEQWLEQKDDLYAGREPRLKTDGDILTVETLCFRFLAHKEGLRDNGELSPRTFETYKATCKKVAGFFGRNRSVEDLSPDDFRNLRAALAKRRGAVALSNEITRVRAVFKFGFDESLLAAPIRFGQAFARPRKDVVDRARESHRAKHGLRMLEADELRLILDTLEGKEVEIGTDEEAGEPLTVKLKANPQLRAMVLLAANTGFGNSDISGLPLRAVDLEGGWVDFARVKNATPRRVPLWAETVQAIREWVPSRTKAKDPADAGLLFLTCRGQHWVKLCKSGAPADAIGQEFCKVLRVLGLKRPRLSFYCLRHGFETVAGDTADQVAVDAIMGHAPRGMAGVYRERIDDARLVRVVSHVRAWLFPPKPDGDQPGKKLSEQNSDPSDPATLAVVVDGSQGSDGSQKSAESFLRVYVG
ncbi:MAG: tyrosine-type recombinase/integrase [Thermoguttaceae bacterium]